MYFHFTLYLFLKSRKKTKIKVINFILKDWVIIWTLILHHTLYGEVFIIKYVYTYWWNLQLMLGDFLSHVSYTSLTIEAC